MRRLWTCFSAAALMMACGSSTPTVSSDSGDEKDVAVDTAPAPQCDYDPALAGKNVGDHVENIKVKDSEGNKYELHANCGTKKAVWVILGTGW